MKASYNMLEVKSAASKAYDYWMARHKDRETAYLNATAKKSNKIFSRKPMGGPSAARLFQASILEGGESCGTYWNEYIQASLCVRIMDVCDIGYANNITLDEDEILAIGPGFRR